MVAGHRQLIREIWPDLISDKLTLHPQDESRATYWPGRKPEDGALLASMTVIEAERLVRTVTHPYPDAFFDQGSQRLRIWQGHPSTDKNQYCDADAKLLKFADGFYLATDYEIEELVAD